MTDLSYVNAKALASNIEAENTARVHALVNLGVNPDQLNMMAVMVRLSAVVEYLKPSPEFEVDYEQRVATALDDIYSQLQAQAALTEDEDGE